MAWSVTLINKDEDFNELNNIPPLTIKKTSTPRSLRSNSYKCNDHTLDAEIVEIEPFNLLFPDLSDDSLQMTYTAFGDILNKPEYKIESIKSVAKLTGVPEKEQMVFTNEDSPNSPEYKIDPRESMYLPYSLTSNLGRCYAFGLIGNSACGTDPLAGIRVFKYLKGGGDLPAEDYDNISWTSNHYPSGNGFVDLTGPDFICSATVEPGSKIWNVSWPAGFYAIEFSASC